MSYIKIEGSKQIIGDEEYEKIVRDATIKIGSRFDTRGHAMQIYFVRDPERIKKELERLNRPTRTTAENIGIDIDDLLVQRAKHLERFLSHEECYIVLWTRPSVLPATESKRASEEAKEKAKDWVAASDAQYPYAALEPLKTRHKSFIASVIAGLDELGISTQTLEVHDALAKVRANLFPDKANEDWRACLPGDPIPTRSPTDKGDLSDILWPNLADQITASDARILGQSIVRIGNTYWAGGDMTLGPMDASPFPQLLNRLVEADIPFRISFLVEGGGAEGTQLLSSIATMLGFTNAANKQVKYSLEGLQAMARNEPVVKLRVSFATWCPQDQKGRDPGSALSSDAKLRKLGVLPSQRCRRRSLGCHYVLSHGYSLRRNRPSRHSADGRCHEIIAMAAPLQPLYRGRIHLLRTPDGKVFPYQTGTNLTTTWFDLIFAQPGAGKSVLLNTLNLGTCLTPGLSQLPFVAVIDIGPSSSGLISLIREALPLERQHEAAYYRLQMGHQYAINPFDTQIGCRAPMPDERSYLVELITLLCTPPGHDKPYDGMQQLAGLVVDEMFRWRSDGIANAEPRPYLPRLEADVDEAINKHNIHLPADPYWWDVVDKMFDIGEYHIAQLAQRHAVPTLNDSITASRRPQIRSLLEETSIGGSAETVISAFERMVTSAIREYPILSSVTQFDIAGARVCSLDLMDVAPQGDDTADRQTSIMYMLARHALVRTWWMDKESLKYVPENIANITNCAYKSLQNRQNAYAMTNFTAHPNPIPCALKLFVMSARGESAASKSSSLAN